MLVQPLDREAHRRQYGVAAPYHCKSEPFLCQNLFVNASAWASGKEVETSCTLASSQHENRPAMASARDRVAIARGMN
jgi:hypothetical protein